MSRIQIDLPSVSEQKRLVYAHELDLACQQLKDNLNAPVVKVSNTFDVSSVSDAHLKTLENGWEPPPAMLIKAWFREFQEHTEFKTDEQLATLLGVGRSRAIRGFVNGEASIPYGLWRRFLILTGRVTQEIIPVVGFFQ